MLWSVPRRRTWNLTDEMGQLHRELGRLFSQHSGAHTGVSAEFPAVNIWKGEDEALVTAEIPGMDPEAIEVTVKDDTLTIRGSREKDALKEGESYLRQERGSGSFVRSFSLPFHVDSGQIKAQYQKGILQVVLPRAEADKPKKIEVRSG